MFNGIGSLCMRPLALVLQLRCLFEGLHGFQNVVNVAWNLEAAPFFFEKTVCADQEGAALNAFDLFAVHDLVFDHAEHVAHFFFGVGDQLKRQF